MEAVLLTVGKLVAIVGTIVAGVALMPKLFEAVGNLGGFAQNGAKGSSVVTTFPSHFPELFTISITSSAIFFSSSF